MHSSYGPLLMSATPLVKGGSKHKWERWAGSAVKTRQLLFNDAIRGLAFYHELSFDLHGSIQGLPTGPPMAVTNTKYAPSTHVCVCVHGCVCVHVRASACVCVFVCMHVRASTRLSCLLQHCRMLPLAPQAGNPNYIQ